MVPVVERLDADEAGGTGGVGDLLGLGLVEGQRLLAEHVLPASSAAQRPFAVPADLEGVVDRVDLGVGDYVGVAVVDLGDPVLRGELLGARAVAGRDAGQFDVVHPRGGARSALAV